MTLFQKFNYSSPDALRSDLSAMGLQIPLNDDTSVLFSPLSIYGKTIANRLAVHPMEGCDGETDGSPSELVYRRYARFARGGCALFWVEACAVQRHARANPRQLWLHKENAGAFARLVEQIRADARPVLGCEPYLVLQLTHSGRYSKPGDGPAVYAAENPYLDPLMSKAYPPHKISDDEIEALEDAYVEAARLAMEAGFDAVDIKACHRYLNSELLSAYTREGRYGGSFENRSRFLLNTVRKVRQGAGADIAVRLNAFDEIPYPYGFGVSQEDFRQPDLTEGKQLMRLLYDNGVRLVNITGGNPYYNPHVNRPYDSGYYTPPVHPLDGVGKLLQAARDLKSSVPADMAVISTGYSWLREYGANMAAGCIGAGWFDAAGFGRQAFAYPDFANDLKAGGMARRKCCIACGKCSEIMRNGSTAGCVVRDAQLYAPIYKASLEGKPAFNGARVAEHI